MPKKSSTPKSVNAQRRIARARSALILKQPFFGCLAMQMGVIERPEVETMATDGKHLYFNADFVLRLSEPKLMGVTAHEVLHVAYLHHTRRGHREPEMWNIAGDYAINRDLIVAGFDMPEDMLHDPIRFPIVMGTEAIYAKLITEREEQKKQQQQQQDKQDDQQDGDQDQDDQDQGDDQSQAGDDQDQDGDDGEAGDQGAEQSDDQGQGDQAGDEGQGEDSDDQDGDQSSGDADGDASDQAIDDEDGAGGASDQSQPGDAQGQQAGAGTAGKPCSDPGRCGGVIDAAPEYDEAAKSQAEAEAQSMIQQALMIAKRQNQGSLPAILQHVKAELDQPKVDWRNEFRRFADESSVKDYSWTQPNRRHIHAGLILPGTVAITPAHIAAVIDTSGSGTEAALRAVASELQGILDEGAAERVTVIYSGDAVQKIETYTIGDVIETQAMPGGGTNFAPAFEAIAELDDQPTAIIYLTDMICFDFGEEPAAPVLWCQHGSYRHPGVPFGEILHIDPYA